MSCLRKKLNKRAALVLVAVLFSSIFGVDACHVTVTDNEKAEYRKAGRPMGLNLF